MTVLPGPRGLKRAENLTCTRFLDFSLISVVLCGWIKGFPLGFLDFSQAVVQDFSCVSDPSSRSKMLFSPGGLKDFLKF